MSVQIYCSRVQFSRVISKRDEHGKKTFDPFLACARCNNVSSGQIFIYNVGLINASAILKYSYRETKI